MNEKKKALDSLRGSFLMFGFDTSNLTDEELEKIILEGNKAIANYGVTFEEAINNISFVFKP